MTGHTPRVGYGIVKTTTPAIVPSLTKTNPDLDTVTPL